MATRGDKFLLGFLAFGILFYLMTFLFSEDESVNSHTNSLAAGTETLTTRYSPDTTQVFYGGSSLASYGFKEDTATRWKLAKSLREISGLAMTEDNRLLAHNDEKGIIFEIDYQNGSIVKAFGLGDLGGYRIRVFQCHRGGCVVHRFWSNAGGNDRMQRMHHGGIRAAA